MKSRGEKSGKAGARRKKGTTDVSPSTSLPPLVEGQLRCFLRVTVGKILWTVSRPPSFVLVRLRWWGETSDGTIFHPRDTSQTEQKTVKTTTRYAVRCGPKQFTSYLTDMGALVLEVMTKLDHLPLGRAQINGISRLSPAHPISGFFTLVSPASEKLGELQVSVALEPLCETYDSNSSLPNTDLSQDAGLCQPKPDGNFLVNSGGRRDSDTSRASTPRGRDHLYFKENTEPRSDPLKGTHNHPNQKDVYLSDIRPSKENMSSVHNTQERPPTDRPTEVPGLPSTPAAKDLLAVLLQQGSKLRDAMAESAMRLDPNLDLDVVPLLPSVLDKENYTSQVVRAALDIPPSHIHRNLLNFHKPPIPKDIILHPTDQNLSELEASSDNRAIELLLGSTAISLDKYWDGTGSPPESIAGSDFYESELNDPQYDQSLLENLFYSVPKSLADVSRDEQSRSVIKGTKNRPVEDEEEHLKKPHAQEGPSLKVLEPKSTERSLRDRTQAGVIDLSVDRLALLGRMHAARVVVESLKVKLEATQVTPGKRSGKGKPPRPACSIKRTYFVEFQFPVSSKNKAGEVSVATEITRLVSSKIVNGVVKFQQKFVFPILFSGHMIKHWWSTDLTFKVFLRKGTQQKPSLLGSAVFCLRDVLRSDDLSVSRSLPVCCTGGGEEIEDAGPLMVSVDIAGDGREFSIVAEKPSGVAQEALSSSLRHSVRIQAPEHQSDRESSPELEALSIHPLVTSGTHHVPREERQPAPPQETTEENGLLLHVVLMVPEGTRLVPGADSATCNSYLNCKLFSSQEASRSNVVWGNSQPVYDFSQVAPVNLTSRLLERLKNNVMIIEVWSKVPSPGSDHLMGLVKLPLHQFYMSFSDQKICRLLLQAQYPVVAVDSFVPIVDVFSRTERGRLKVLLAMGSGDQVVALQRLKNDEGTLLAPLPRPAHFLDPPQPTTEVYRAAESAVDHVFDIHVENVKGLTPLQSTVWGEADCYVQYYFPVQTPVTGLEGELPERCLSLKPVRTATTLCVPDPAFNDRQSHTLVAPSDTPVQRLLLSAYSMQGLSAGGGVTFEIWCRYYYPNVRDQMVAKGVLPLSRLCAMVTMHHREEVGIQAFCLPLTLRNENTAETHPPSSGLLNVNVTYRRSVRNPVGILATRMVSISVQIHRAAGLQAAARALAEQEPSFQYSADVGVNAFVIIRPSFLPEMESRNTRTVARSFCPEFDHHSEFPCNILTHRSSGEACSLAEILHFSEIVLSIHHQSIKSAGGKIHPNRDYHLGVVRIPGRDLLSKRSGMSGWYPVILPEESALPRTTSILNNVVGGLELSVSFAHHSDRERVLEVARGLGWNDTVEEISENVTDGWEKEDLVRLSVTVPKIWLPVHCLLLAGHKHIHKKVYCYLRYKLYDRDAVCSNLRKPTLSEDGQQVTVTFEQTRDVELMKHQPLVWYLREEKLEIQIWRSYGKDTSGPRPQDTDRLLGCAYVDMSALAETSSRTLSVSGVYPLFKRNVPNLQGAAVRVHLCLSSAYHPSVSVHCTSSAEDQSLSEEEAAEDTIVDNDRTDDDHRTAPKKSSPRGDHPPALSDSQPVRVDVENTFAVVIVVERAMHLSLKGSPLTERQVSTPSYCVSFPVADSASPVTTPVIENTDSPTWNFQHQARLTKELLLDPQHTLVFKAWHRTGDVERVLGFASVDLSPLLSGFQSVCGWYNIGDFTGQCQGQIKVSITPLENIAYLREQRWTRSCTNVQPQVTPHTSFLFQPSPIFSFPLHQAEKVEGLINPTERREDTFPPVGNTEYTETMRRFQESVHQAEQIAQSAEHMEVLSQSSNTSLQSSLRRNLNELDDIQKYFNQKLYRSLSSTAPPGGATEHSTEKKSHVSSTSEDADAQLLLQKSSLLVSQVSNLITGLQEKAILREVPPSTVDGGNSQQHLSVAGSEVTGIRPSENVWPVIHEELSDNENGFGRVDTPPFSEVEFPIRKDNNMKDLLSYIERQNSFVVDHEEEEPEDDLQQDSDEEYEENVIEPRTLNEITSLTDRTSPWSSMVSEPEHDPQIEPVATEDVPTNGNLLEKPSLISSVLHNDQNSNPTTTRSCDSYVVDKHPETTGRAQGNGSDTQKPGTWVDSQSVDSLGQNSSDLSDNDDEDRLRDEEVTLEGIQLPTEMSLSGSEPDESPDLSMEREDNVGEERDDYKSEYPSSSPHPESSQRDTSPSAQSVEELPDVTETTSTQHFDLLSDPIQLPNFFLPPQHLEASMRLLSQSSLPPSSAPKVDGETQIAKGIPFRRRTRQTPKINADEVPEKEAKRIARIFAAQFPNK